MIPKKPAAPVNAPTPARIAKDHPNDPCRPTTVLPASQGGTAIDMPSRRAIGPITSGDPSAPAHRMLAPVRAFTFPVTDPPNTRIVVPGQAPGEVPTQAVSVGEATYEADPNDTLLDVIFAGAAITLPQNPIVGAAPLVIQAEVACTLSAGPLGPALAPSDPLSLSAGSLVYAARGQGGWTIAITSATGGVTAVTASGLLASSGGATPDITLLAGGVPGDIVTNVGGVPEWVPPAGGGGGIGLGAVIWRPGGVAVPNQVATTPAELQAAITAGCQPVIVDSSIAAAIIPAGFTLSPSTPTGVIQMQSYNGVSGGDIITVAATGVIKNLTLLLGGLAGSFSASSLVYSNPDVFLIIRGGSSATLQSAAAGPAISVGAGQTVFVSSEFVSLVQGNATQPFIKATGGTAFLLAFSFSSVAARAIGQSSGTAIVFFDATISPAPETIGTVTLTPLSQDMQLVYGSGTAFPATAPGGIPLRVGMRFFRTDLNVTFTWNGTVWVIAAFQSSTTGGRPVATTVGQTDFDTTLNIPIWWNGAAWVNSVGAPV